MQGSLRTKILIGFLSIAALICLMLGFALYQTAREQFFNQFKEHKLSLAKSLAESIDGDVNRSFDSEEAEDDPRYQQILSYLKKVLEEEEFVTYIISINYNAEDDSWYHSFDAYDIKTDTVWLESEVAAGEVVIRDGKLTMKWDEVYRTQPFSLDTTNDSVAVSFGKDGEGNEALFFDGQMVLSVVTQEPLTVKIPGDQLVHADNWEGAAKLNLSGKEYELEYAFSAKGELSTYPGDDFVDTDQEMEKVKRILESGEPYVDPEAELTSWGHILTAYAPVKNSKGETTGLMLIDVNVKQIDEFEAILRNIAFGVTAIAFVIAAIVGVFLSRYLTGPLVALTGSVDELAQGNYDIVVKIERKDEIGRLALQFNSMVSELRTVYNDLSVQNKSFSRFVPRQFLGHLGRESVVDITLGDQVQQVMTILFQDIRSFTTLSEGMTPKENFDFINAFLGRLGPIIRENDGFVDKYIGDAIMALFPSEATRAVDAAIAMQKRVERYNGRRMEVGFDPIRIGIGLHTGSLMLGTIGEEERMEGTVISDSVNVASRMEGLTKTFGAPVVMSEATLQNLDDPTKYNIRFLGKSKVKGKAKSLSVFEILDGETDAAAKLKMDTKGDFERGVHHFFKKKLDEAEERFRKVLDVNPNDKAAQLYMANIERYRNKRKALFAGKV